ncbi:phosphonate ABC transporter ATP-binding protein [Halopseudomonas sp.]|uniref:phosphonate ABC transporter ATP-binding protein n=1 Tax=Halopseudomonas sp. TaxID=2901191 RepID=UPI003562E358
MGVQLEGVGLTHPGGVTALQGLDLRIAAGERVAIVGSSGAGKTTLLRLLATGLTPTSGQLTLLGEVPARLRSGALKKLRSRIGLIYQSPPLPPRQRVVTAVQAGRLGQWSLPRALLSLCYPLDIRGVEQVLAPLDLTDKLFSRCDQLSGGQLQRVGIARVMYQRAGLLLADEPVAAMDPVLANHTLALLNRLAAEREVTLVASLHAVDLALKHFPRIIGLRAGRVHFDCPAGEVTAELLDSLYANDGLGSAQPASTGNHAGTEASASAPRTAQRCL